jgi:hypothetical protein
MTAILISLSMYAVFSTIALVELLLTDHQTDIALGRGMTGIERQRAQLRRAPQRLSERWQENGVYHTAIVLDKTGRASMDELYRHIEQMRMRVAEEAREVKYG